MLLATTGRPEMAETCVRSVRATTSHVEIVAAVDVDRETVRRLEPLVDHLTWSDSYRGRCAAWNDAFAASTADPVVLAADDLVFRYGWLDAALRELADLGWGLVGFNDGRYGEELSTHYMVSRRLVNELFGGRAAWEDDQNACDVYANDVARRAGLYRWCSDAHVDHLPVS